MRYTTIPMLCIRPGMVFAYDILDPHPCRQSLDMTAGKLPRPHSETYSGKLTEASKRRLIKAINLLVAISRPKKAVHFDTGREFKFRVNFITLTLPAPQREVTDKELKLKCLKPFLEYWRDKHPEFTHVWRAERQGNGNLHFHLITNTYIHYKDLRDSWNRHLRAFHFIDEFKSSHGHEFPNSTDVHAVKQIRNLAAYIAKYMSKKEEEGQSIEGKVWDCSARLKTKAKCSWPIAASDHDAFMKIWEALPGQTFNTDFCAGIRLTEREMRKHFPDTWVQAYSAYLERIRTS